MVKKVALGEGGEGREGMTCINYQRFGRRQPGEKCPEVRVAELGRHLSNFAGDLPSFLGI